MNPEQARWFGENFAAIVNNVERAIVGKTEAIRLAVTCMLAEGHLLLEDYPGTGKTTLASGIVAGLGATGPVTSPTFSLVHEYRDGRLPVFHLDFYRLDTIHELVGIGWDDILDEGGVVIVEWADRFPAALPEHTLWIALDAGAGNARSATIGRVTGGRPA